MAGKKNFFWQIAGVVFLWRMALFLVAGAADWIAAYDPSFPYAREVLAVLNLPRWLYSWAGFDGVHYLGIAQHGYANTAFVQAFFPVFPLLLRLFSSTVLAGLILNLLLTVCLTGVLYQLARLDFPERTARWSLAALLLFPTSFFFGALYSETLFLLLTAGAFLMARKNQWQWASILGAVVSATRIIGIVLLPALLWELWQQRKPASLSQFLRRNFRELSWLSLSVLGIGAYMLYLWKMFGDPLYFLHVQSEFGSGRQESIVLLPQVFWRYGKILLTARPFDWKYFSYVQDLFLSSAVLAALVFGYKRIRPSYLVFSLLAFLIPTLSGTFSSMPRYVLVCFPLYFLFGELSVRKPGWRNFLLTASVILLIINTILFIQGYWVA